MFNIYCSSESRLSLVCIHVKECLSCIITLGNLPFVVLELVIIELVSLQSQVWFTERNCFQWFSNIMLFFRTTSSLGYTHVKESYIWKTSMCSFRVCRAGLALELDMVSKLELFHSGCRLRTTLNIVICKTIQNLKNNKNISGGSHNGHLIITHIKKAMITPRQRTIGN